MWSYGKIAERQTVRHETDKWTNGGLSRSPRWKNETIILESHFSLSLTNTTLPPHLFVFFLPLSLSLSLSSPCVVSLIGRQTACKCSNPEKSPGALVIGCAMQHSSQSIKARWAPVNSFSLLLLWLWYCHIDSNFALNPSTTVLSSFSLSLSLSLSLHFSFFFKPQIPSLYCYSKLFLSLRACVTPPIFFFLEFLLLSHLEPLLPSLTLSCHLEFQSVSVSFMFSGRKSKTRKETEMK